MERVTLALLFAYACVRCSSVLASESELTTLPSEGITSLANVEAGRLVDADAEHWPGWLQNEVGHVGLAKSRKRRFIPFPTGSTLNVKVTLKVPVVGISDSGNVKVIGTATYNLPNDTVSIGRNYVDAVEDRHSLYHRMESFLDGMGYDGHTCTLRTLCEVNESPFEHGLYGEVVNLIMQVSPDPEETGGYDDYMTAEYYGQNYGDCEEIYKTCPHSVLDYVTHAF